MIRFRTLLFGLVGLAVAGVVAFWAGIVPIGASTGHWGLTDWVLHTAMRRSVKFYARDAEPPADWGDPALVRRGAGHYETGCAACHGSPAVPRGPVPRAMTPSPPELEPRIADWEPKHLFWIVMHGVKFSGMPAWPAPEREDEAWALAAFLRALPGMDAAEYRRLAWGEAEATTAPGALSLAADPPLADCVRCHGRDGLGAPDGAFPRLDIQTEAYLLAALRAYAAGSRQSGIMESAVSPLAEADLVELARHYAQPRPVAPAPLAPEDVPPELLARGERIAREGLPGHDVAACLGCHGPDATGRPEFPRLHGQYRNYLALQLRLFASGARGGGSPFFPLMAYATHALDEAQIQAVSAWFASRDPTDLGRAHEGAAGADGTSQ